jgi:protein TorT
MRKVLGVSVFVMTLCSLSAMAADEWKFPVQEKLDDGRYVPVTYESLNSKEVTKKWNICFSVPHVKDAYYQAIVYGAVTEAKRLGVKLSVVPAGGYGFLSKQVDQIEDCIASGANAIVIMAISPVGLNQALARAKKNGVVLVDLINGIKSDDITARMVGNYGIAGAKVGEYIRKKNPTGKARVIWLPGPGGVSWSEDGLRGFQDAVKNSNVQIVQTKYGEPDKAVQMRLLEDAIQTNPDVEYIVGNVPATEGSVQVLRQHGHAKGSKGNFAFYYGPSMHAGIKDGTISGAITDNTVMMARTSIDQAVRALEKKTFYKNLEPNFLMIDSSNIDTYNVGASLAPEKWKPVFRVD